MMILKTSTVPKEEFITLQNQFSNFVPREIFEEMQRSFSQTTVPRERLLASEARLQELETKIANSIPRSDHEELVAEIASLIVEAPQRSNASDTQPEPQSGAQETEVAVPLVTSTELGFFYPLQDSQRGKRDPFAWLSFYFKGKWFHLPSQMVLCARAKIGMNPLKYPPSIQLALLLQDLERRLKAAYRHRSPAL